jgi:hypothetical protein
MDGLKVPTFFALKSSVVVSNKVEKERDKKFKKKRTMIKIMNRTFTPPKKQQHTSSSLKKRRIILSKSLKKTRHVQSDERFEEDPGVSDDDVQKEERFYNSSSDKCAWTSGQTPPGRPGLKGVLPKATLPTSRRRRRRTT